MDCWGDGYYGELGHGMYYTTGNAGSATPVQVEGVGGTGTLTGVRSLAGGNYDTCAVLTSDTVVCWGIGGDGALGNGGEGDSASPVEVEGVGGTGTLTGVADVVGDGDNSCALLTTGAVDAWGSGIDGELGDGTFYTTSPFGSDIPVAVEGVGGTGHPHRGGGPGHRGSQLLCAAHLGRSRLLGLWLLRRPGQ